MKKRILVTNDDGVRSEGILLLADALRPLGVELLVSPITPPRILEAIVEQGRS